jgi:cellulose synthase/poly-beta-1,6-N-acetylglucosamine synthase-like glycosyltransferase
MKNKLLKVCNIFFDSGPIERKPRKKPFIIFSKLCLYLLLIILFLFIIRVLKSYGWLFLPLGLISLLNGFEKYFNKEEKWDVFGSFGVAISCILIFIEKITI